MTWQTGLSLGAGGIVLVAILLFWNAGLVCGRYDTRERRGLRMILQIAASALLGLALVLFLTALFDGSAVAVAASLMLMFIFAAGGFVVVWVQFRITRRQSLIWTLSAAADKGVPLHDAAHAFADENSGDAVAKNLSMYLQAGAPLPEALKLAGIRLPLDARLAVDAGHRLKLLGPFMNNLLSDSHQVESTVREIVERIWYFLAVSLVTSAVFMFVITKISPVMQRMVADFAIPTNGPWDFHEVMIASASWIGLAMFLLVVTLMGCSLIGAMYYIGALPINAPGTGVLARRLDSARLLRVLGVASQNGRSLQETLRILTLYYPRFAVRARLHRAGEMVSAGRNWISSLRQTGLITEADAGVMESAQRAGNLAWAMNDLSATSSQRFIHRIRFVISIVFPVLSCIMGILVMFFVLALFGPLVTMIEALS